MGINCCIRSCIVDKHVDCPFPLRTVWMCVCVVIQQSLSSAAAQAKYIALVQTVDPSFALPALPSAPEVSASTNEPTVAAVATSSPTQTSSAPSQGPSASGAAVTADAASSSSTSHVEAATSASAKPPAAPVAIRGIEVCANVTVMLLCRPTCIFHFLSIRLIFKGSTSLQE
jgi:cobalamin biosynthesis Mg chelatase CobN